MNTVSTTHATSVFISHFSHREKSRQASSTGWNRFPTEKVKRILKVAVQSLSCGVIYRTITPSPVRRRAGDVLLSSLEKGPNQVRAWLRSEGEDIPKALLAARFVHF